MRKKIEDMKGTEDLLIYDVRKNLDGGSGSRTPRPKSPFNHHFFTPLLF
jgi:hypothetical protein